MIGGRDERDARGRYSRFVISGISKDMNMRFWEGVRGQVILGWEDFFDWVTERFLSKEKGDIRDFPALKARRGGPSNTEEIGREVALRFGVEEEALYRRYASCRDARSVFIELCCQYLSRKMSFLKIARELGGLSVPALSKNRKRLSAKMKRDKGLKRKFDDFKKLWDSGS